MASSSFHHDTITDAELVALCSDPNREIVGNMPYVVKISDRALVKYGIGVREEEANNLRRAYELLDRDVVRVPRVHRFFMHEDKGYLVMEYIDGRIAEPPEYPALAENVLSILSHFKDIRGKIPGPLCGGVSRGLLWESDNPKFGTTKAMEDWFNTRLLKEDGSKVAFESCELVLCHLDIAPRNILWLDDHSICFLDWTSAGYYPRSFEFAMLELMAWKSDGFNEMLLRSMEPLRSEDQALVRPILQAWSNSQRCYL